MNAVEPREKISLARTMASNACALNIGHSTEIREAEQEDRQIRDLVRDLQRPNPVIYWADLLLTGLIGWTSLVMAVALQPFSLGMLAASTIAIFALYRGLCFIHELSHLNRNVLPGFEGAYNILVGYPFLMPSFVYVGVHQYHHRLSTYGTIQDPEYLPFARSWIRTTTFALHGFLIPIGLLIRFLVLSPIGFVSQKIQNWLIIKASSLSMNPRYRREVTPGLVRKIRIESALMLALWSGAIALAVTRVLPWRAFGVWLLVCSFISFINCLRTLGAHAYESTGEVLDRTGQLLDSIDTPGAFWSELWAPVGLRYHALHHYFPGIPYHNLAEGYRRAIHTLPERATYRKSTSPSLPHSLRELYKKGVRYWSVSRRVLHRRVG